MVVALPTCWVTRIMPYGIAWSSHCQHQLVSHASPAAPVPGAKNLNYPGLRTLYDKYHDDGFNLIAFPCNQFGGQAPGTSEKERQWAFRKFGFEFDVFDKIEVNGPNAHPLYKFMRQQQPVSSPGAARPVPRGGPGAIEWNYTKFLVNTEGQAVQRYKPGFDPLDFEGDVRLVLAGKSPLDPECLMHPGRKGCKVERLLQQA
eukprot:GHUV01041106.1.p1 GENE.GHUV01041106.1~~GHUV01041106.1.p1  ORF type:complete len:202 (+),score=53.06 GHUV01041106.1:197-802(+)